MNENMDRSGADRNYLIDIFRLFFSIQIVIIHTAPFKDIHGVVFNAIVSLLSQTAVPFFFFVSAYFYLNKIQESSNFSSRYKKKLLITYLLWSFIYFGAGFLLLVYHNSGMTEYLSYIKELILAFFTTGSSFQLWYLVALIYCVIITAFFQQKQKMNIFCNISIVLFSLYMISNHIPFGKNILFVTESSKILSAFYALLVNLIRAMMYFTVTYYFIKYEKVILHISKIKILLAFICSVSIYVIYYYINQGVDPVREIFPFLRVVLLVILMIWILLIPHKKNSRHWGFFSGAAAFSYYAHPLIAMAWDILLFSILKISISNLLRFILTLTTCILTAYILYKWNNRYLNKLFK